MTMIVRAQALAVAAMAALAFFTPAAAQQKVLNSPREIGRCLCQERAIDELRRRMDARKADVDREKAEVDALDREIAQQRPRVNTDDPIGIEVFKTLLDQRDAKWNNLKSVTETAYLESTDRYNTAVLGFQASCGGTLYDVEALAIARNNLVCPAN